jgi:alpha-1,6-mannosyltransferase
VASPVSLHKFFSINRLIWIIGLSLLCLFTFLAIISPNFKYELPLIEKPVLLMTSILIISGVIFLYLIQFLGSKTDSKRLLIWIITIGILLRVVTIFSTPILEDDYYRYLWDGAVTANGENPYKYAPKSIVDDDPSVPANLKLLAKDSGKAIERINHPHIRTIYPMVTQLFFAAGYLLSPWNIVGWRIVLLLVDLVNLVLLLKLLKFFNLSSALVLIYWWNPLLIKEIFNSGHMDILVIPFVFGAILLLMRNRHLASSGLLALGVGVKLWPVLLLPLFLKKIYPDHKKLLLAFLIFVVISIMVFVPVYTSGIDETSGLRTYSKSWENNDALFMLVVWIWQFILPIFGIHSGYAQLAARITVFSILGILILLLIPRNNRDNFKLLSNCLIIIAAAFLISPTQFPWYFVWLIPFLALKPKISLLILTALLPLYYLRFYLEPRGNIELFNYGIVWIEFVPVWALLISDWLKSRKERLILMN